MKDTLWHDPARDALPVEWHAPELQTDDDSPLDHRCLVTLSLGHATFPRPQVDAWTRGTLMRCPHQRDDFVDVIVDGTRIARGVPIVWQGRLCVRITETLAEPWDDSCGEWTGHE